MMAVLGGAFDLRSGVFHVASDIYLRRNDAIDETTGKESIYEFRLAMLIMEPDARGHVIPAKGIASGETTVLTDLKGQLSATNIRGNLKKTQIIGNWLTVRTSEPAHFTPTLCEAQEMPTEENKNFRDYRYRAKIGTEQDNEGTFGCREWAFQLYNVRRPYIDVTSYLKIPRINRFIGWAREGDKKPVIGLNFPNWICLYDCPNGDQPGVIPDILVWAKKNGWEPPQPPAKMPMFPDPIR